jgi:hypothetical protein
MIDDSKAKILGDEIEECKKLYVITSPFLDNDKINEE